MTMQIPQETLLSTASVTAFAAIGLIVLGGLMHLIAWCRTRGIEPALSDYDRMVAERIADIQAREARMIAGIDQRHQARLVAELEYRNARGRLFRSA
jgi:hypothetical protein